jgi:hypothetical protein
MIYLGLDLILQTSSICDYVFHTEKVHGVHRIYTCQILAQYSDILSILSHGANLPCCASTVLQLVLLQN